MSLADQLEKHSDNDALEFRLINEKLGQLNGLRWYFAGVIAVLCVLGGVLYQTGPWIIKSAMREAVISLDVVTGSDMAKLEKRLNSLEERANGICK